MIADRSRIRLAGFLALAAIHLAVTRCPAQPVQEPAPRGGPPQVWAVLVGIERYEDEVRFPRSRGAARDAVAVARWLTEEAGWGRDHLRLLIDREPSEPVKFRDPGLRPDSQRPTRHAIEAAISDWLTPRARPGDVALIFFAGQAVSLPPARDGGGRPPRDYLIPWDGVRDKEETWWRPGDALDGLARRGVAVVCLLDTSPTGRNRTPIIGGERLHVAPEHRLRLLEGIARWPGVTAWMAATDRTAGETDDGHGLLTAALLKALGTRGGQALGLHACLQRLRRDQALAGQGFRTVGEFAPGLSLWPNNVRLTPPKVDPLLQRGHADRVTGIAFRSDGGRMITSSMDSTVRVWRTSDSFLLQAIPWTSNGYHSLDLGGDGRLLVAGGGKGDVLFFDTATETRLTWPGLPQHAGPVSRVAVLADGRHAVTLDNLNGRCIVWEVDLGAGRLRALENPVAEAGGSLLAVATRPGDVAFALVVRDADDRETIRLCDAEGKIRNAFSPPMPADRPGAARPERITAVSLSDDGERVVLGTETGRVVDCDRRGNRTRADRTLPGGEVRPLAVQPLWVMAGCGRSAWLLTGREEARTELPMGEPIEQLVASADGRRVAACGQQGVVRAWEIAADGREKPIDLGQKEAGDGLSLAFSPGGDVLAVGHGSGQVRAWQVPGKPRAGIPASTGRLGHLAVSTDGLSLLQVTWNGARHSPGRASVWRFGEERGTRPVPGSFLQGGGFLPDGRLVLLDERGDVVIHDGATLERTATRFSRPPAEDGQGETTWAFTTLAISGDGRLIAAGSDDGALACVWTTADGRRVKTIRGDGDKVRAVRFADDGRSLLTAGDDGRARIWEIGGADATPRQPRDVRPPLDADAAGGLMSITAAAMSPRDVLAAGRSDGGLELWKPGAVRPQSIGRLGGEVKAIAFSPDGRWLAAAGDHPRITLVETANPGRTIPLATIRDERRLQPHHSEMITALAFWPDGKRLASASLDSTIRLWDLERRTLVGTLASLDDGAQWVAYTPDGIFDGSRAAERRVAWRLDPNWWPGEGDGLIATFDQLGDRYRQFDLADSLSRGRDIAPPGLEAPAGPRLVVEQVSRGGDGGREVVLRIRSSTPEVKDLRLYHNGVSLAANLRPVGTDYEATVKLVSQQNEIYALGSRAPDRLGLGGAADAISNRIELSSDAPTSAQLHILALGISNYKAQALRYAHEDARSIAGFLGHKGLAGVTVSEPIMLLNHQVTRAAVDDAFEQLRRRVRGRPEDTVVVFLAGHASVRRGRFCLLLPEADLPDQPIVAGEQLALRGPVEAPPSRLLTQNDPTILPYSSIHLQLSFVEALQRLVIIDACQAEAIYDNMRDRSKTRRTFEKMADAAAHQARTSYILATRRGEREAEPRELEHGVLTYALLRGMGEPELRRPAHLRIFDEYPTADLNQDGWIQADELRRYARLTVPVVAERFQGTVRGDAGAAGRGAATPEPPASISADVDDSASFRLIPAPRGDRPRSP